MPQYGRNPVGQAHHGEQRARKLHARMTGARQKSLHEQGNNKKDRQQHPANPPCHRRPRETQGHISEELKEKNTRSREHGSGEQEPGSQNQRDAILCPLKADQRYGCEYERQQTGDDMKVAMEHWIGGNGDVT